MKKNDEIDVKEKGFFVLIILLALCFATVSNIALAQEPDIVEEEEIEEEPDNTDKVELEPVVSTGSRLLRTTYESLSPVQVITLEEARDVGQIDAGDILQNSTAASGQQIDLTFSGFVLDNGPGARTISFRGLGSNRTLLLINGRRVGGSGVEGAPSAPDLNMIPGGLVQQYDFLLDGASSVYGSDAVAGVANYILRKDFDGFEVDYSITVPEQSAGTENRLGITWGKNFDRGFIGFGAEIYELEEIKYSDRDAFNKCPEHLEITESGEVRSIDLFSREIRLADEGTCYNAATSGWTQLIARRNAAPGASLTFGSAYYTPGRSNGGYPDFTLRNGGSPIDGDGDGIADFGTLRERSLYPHLTGASLFAGLKTQNVFTYGEYTFEGDSNLTPFFEFGYSRRDTFQDGGQGQLFPWVPEDNPYNICNPNGLNGVDCGLAYDAIPGITTPIGEFGAFRTRPIVAVAGDRDNTSVTVEQTRVLVGLKGDIPQLEIGSLSGWRFETYLSHHESDGTASRLGIREDRLNYSLATSRIDPNTGQVICGDNDGCVPINMYAPSLFNSLVGNFATPEERAYLFDSRDFRTKVRQTILSAFTSGYLFDLPAGPVAGGIGFEVRKDAINSIPDDIARDGLFFGFFADTGATGSKFTREAFFEFNVPLLADLPGVTELNLELSGRHTKDEFFPSAQTYSVKLGYRPIDSLLLKATLGTSTKAPNLRENFLAGQSGFAEIGDPCIVPEDAFNEDTGEYERNLDRRLEHVLENCRNDGVDPTTLFYTQSSVEIFRGGATDITEEKSDSFTYGFSWDVPTGDNFDLTLGATYYSIKVNNTIISPSGGFIVGDCYGDPELDSPFCARITRDAEGELTAIDAGFINRDNQTVRGVDVNLNYDQSFTLFNQAIDFGSDLILTHTEERSSLFIDDEGVPSFNEDAGEYGYPDWTGALTMRADIGKYRVTWRTRYIGAVNVDPIFVEGNAFDDIDGATYTCGGPDRGDELCRFIYETGGYTNHTLSLSYRSDDWTVRLGVINLFDKEPPKIDGNTPGVIEAVNTPLGYGYDINGRRVFLNVNRRF
ncbi:MAG: TonB-dependent receptor [Proteobacteria bacterium]|nr:TonB-dependent receptor [Pseudomonadota bacterium]